MYIYTIQIYMYTGSSRMEVQHRFGVRAIGGTFHLKAIHHNICTYIYTGTVCSMAIAHILLVCFARAARRGPRKLVIGSTKRAPIRLSSLVRSLTRPTQPT